MTREQIFKVQLPVFITNAAVKDAQALVYNRDRSVLVELPATKKLRAKVNDELKSFWFGSINNGKLELTRKAEWQTW